MITIDKELVELAHSALTELAEEVRSLRGHRNAPYQILASELRAALDAAAGECKISELLPCPFCGKPVDLEDEDVLYPSGTGWLFNEELQMRTYHSGYETPKEQWCYVMRCPEQAGGCGAEMHGDTKDDVLAKWNARTALTEAVILAASEQQIAKESK